MELEKWLGPVPEHPKDFKCCKVQLLTEAPVDMSALTKYVVVSEVDWQSINEMKRRWDARLGYSKEYNTKKRAQKKVDRGLDPNLNERANKRPGETDEEHAKRIERNRKHNEWRNGKKRRIEDGTWQSQPKLSKEEKREKKIEYLRAWRLKQKENHQATP
jgi:hypothetical protein